MLITELKDFDQLQSRLANLVGSVDEIEILDETSALLFNRIRTRFLQETAPDGTKWKPSKAAQRRAISGRGGGTLFDTGRLFYSLQLSRVEPNGRLISTDVPYASFVNYGTNRLPPRIFMDYNSDDFSAMVDLIAARIEAKLSA